MFTILSKMNNPLNQKGFTLVELIMVLVIIAIIGAVVSPSLTGSGQSAFNMQNAADLIKSDILFTQRKAMGGDSTNNKIEFFSGSGTYTRAGDTQDLSGLNSALTISTTVTITFNSFGEPDSTSPVTITVSLGGNTQNLTVEPYTGYVSIS